VAIAIHGSSPAIATGDSTTVITATFSPPADSLLVACVFAIDGDSATIGVSNSGTAQTWTQRARRDEADSGSRIGLAAIYTAPNATAQTNITVTATTNNNGGIGLKVYVVTGVSLTTPVGATGEGSSTTNNVTVAAYTSTGAGSRGIAVAHDASQTGTPTSTDDESAVLDFDTGLTGMGIVKASNTATPGTSVMFNLDASGTDPAEWNWAAVELLNASIDATASPAVVSGAADIPSVGLAAGSTVSAAVVSGAADIPAAGMSAGAGISPGAVIGTAIIPTPVVAVDDVEAVDTTAVLGAADIPTPTLSAGTGVAATAVLGAADIPTPTLSAQFQAALFPAAVVGVAVIPTPSILVPVLPGELITDAGQVEFGTTLWGTGTDFRVVGEIAGWESLPTLDDQSANRPSRHGAWPGRRLAQQRIINIDLQIDSAADPTLIDLKLRELGYATRVLDNDTEWSLVIRGYGEPLLAYGSIRDRDIPFGGNYNVGLPQAGIVIGCTDPRRYALTQQSVVVPVGGEPQTLTNGGDVYTSPRIRIQGPCTNPVLINETLDRVLAVDIVLGSDDVLNIYTQLGDMKVGDVDHMDNLSDSASVPVEDFVLTPGGNVLTFEADSGGASGAEFLFRTAYL